jgi:hypothetical protein
MSEFGLASQPSIDTIELDGLSGVMDFYSHECCRSPLPRTNLHKMAVLGKATDDMRIQIGKGEKTLFKHRILPEMLHFRTSVGDIL